MFTLLYYALLCWLAVMTAGGAAYCLIALFSVRRLRRKMQAASTATVPTPPMSLLKPLRGAEAGLEEYLTTFFQQDYPTYEILFAVREESDPAVAVVNRLRQRFPAIPVKLLLTGQPPYANAKVYSMEKMAEAAAHSLLIITDSDASVAPDYLLAMAREFASPKVGAVTNLYRGVPGRDFWSRLEALGMSTEFMAGVVVAERMEGMKFALGPSMAISKECLLAIGGFAAMADYLADDFVLGHWSAEAGYEVRLSAHVINHHASTVGFLETFKHRLRWNRSSRYSRPSGYYGQGFTYFLPWTILLFLFAPAAWSLAVLLIVLGLRGWLALELGLKLLGDKTVSGSLWLVPLQDAISFATWLGGLKGREIIWRNERYRLHKGGRFAPVTPRGSN
ncbi:MAG TPA: bacteriohopanetetrol glucosamine biosynthesis glycosyltransferase HpnI [Blastocatellia bacterium]|nr:bacteriohopanetetrol glucosamine biosynthesis glycosyltransferase HpnI [Blastocatellia bacterium]HMY71468.1 bacteriohopanetetrol glucosamine biosynthesis glycosyltransferase HpnI [Blastocatellia bacterium]